MLDYSEYNLGPLKKITFLSVPPLGYQGIRDTGGYETDTISTIISRIISLYRGNEFAILRVFKSQKSPFTTKIAG